MEKLADLAEETKGSGNDVPLGDEDMSDEAMEGLEDHMEDEEEEEEKKSRKKKASKKKGK